MPLALGKCDVRLVALVLVIAIQPLIESVEQVKVLALAVWFPTGVLTQVATTTIPRRLLAQQAITTLVQAILAKQVLSAQVVTPVVRAILPQ